MRIDKLTTKFQEALSDAQSLALGKDHAYIEPVHVLATMLKQDDGPKAILLRAVWLGSVPSKAIVLALIVPSVIHALLAALRFFHSGLAPLVSIQS